MSLVWNTSFGHFTGNDAGFSTFWNKGFHIFRRRSFKLRLRGTSFNLGHGVYHPASCSCYGILVLDELKQQTVAAAKKNGTATKQKVHLIKTNIEMKRHVLEQSMSLPSTFVKWSLIWQSGRFWKLWTLKVVGNPTSTGGACWASGEMFKEPSWLDPQAGRNRDFPLNSCL